MVKRILNDLEEGIISFLLASMTLLVFVEVILRFVFNTGLMWAQEMTLLLSAWMVLFGVSYGVKVGSHIGVDAIVRLLPRNAKRVVSAIACLLAMVYCVLIIKGSYVYLMKMRMIGLEMEDLPVQRWIAQSILVIGMLLLGFRLVQLFIRILRDKADGFSLHDESKDARGMYEAIKAEEEENKAAGGAK
ncbi:TRAP transporter small permease [Oceanidesulfovibrio indonesiensis]|uniref:TRAP transporter small permease n=1 Tax=Oceanidesulfovibrio indonesiensis TaxID=54767 RepID=A0A7M3MDU8_9BACT|nr:TRAP transporter small permease [Oceanidesulfovibrio indonesiensis]TVM16891.1 TRAP transporter small permease [Oceanidesulfovibrio indonesiensis]